MKCVESFFQRNINRILGVFKVGKWHLLLTFTSPILTEAFKKQGKERNWPDKTLLTVQPSGWGNLCKTYLRKLEEYLSIACISTGTVWTFGHLPTLYIVCQLYHSILQRRHNGESWVALAKSGSMQEAQLAIALLHGRQVGVNRASKAKSSDCISFIWSHMTSSCSGGTEEKLCKGGKSKSCSPSQDCALQGGNYAV